MKYVPGMEYTEETSLSMLADELIDSKSSSAISSALKGEMDLLRSLLTVVPSTSMNCEIHFLVFFDRMNR